MRGDARARACCARGRDTRPLPAPPAPRPCEVFNNSACNGTTSGATPPGSIPVSDGGGACIDVPPPGTDFPVSMQTNAVTGVPVVPPFARPYYQIAVSRGSTCPVDPANLLGNAYWRASGCFANANGLTSAK